MSSSLREINTTITNHQDQGMDAHERLLRLKLEEEERLDAVDPLRHLLCAGDSDDDDDEEEAVPKDDGQAAAAAAHASATATAPEGGGLRYKLNEGNDLVPAQRAAIEGDVRAVVRYFSPRVPTALLARAPVTFGLTNPPSTAADGTEFAAHDVHLHQDVATGCGGRIWPAAEVLGAYLARDRARWAARWAGREVLELGSGTGLLGLLCAVLGLGRRVLITDQDAMMKLMERNIELNEDVLRAEGAAGLPTPCVAAELNWGEPLPEDVPSRPEVLLLADCVYLEVAFQPLVDTMVELSTPATEILFCYQKRRKADKRFFLLLKKHFDFEHVEDDDPEYRQKYNREGTQLLRVTKKK